MRMRNGEALAGMNGEPCKSSKVIPVAFSFYGHVFHLYVLKLNGELGWVSTDLDYRIDPVLQVTTSSESRKFLSSRFAKKTLIPLTSPPVLVAELHNYILRLLFKEIAQYDFTYVTPIAFRDLFKDMMEVVVCNRFGDWGFLHPLSNYILQEVSLHWWRTEAERQGVVEQYEQIWESSPKNDEDLENHREFMQLHRHDYQLIAKEGRREMALEKVIPNLTQQLGLRSFPEEPERLWHHDGFHYTDLCLYKKVCRNRE